MISCKQVSPLIVLSINTPKPTRGLDALSINLCSLSRMKLLIHKSLSLITKTRIRGLDAFTSPMPSRSPEREGAGGIVAGTRRRLLFALFSCSSEKGEKQREGSLVWTGVGWMATGAAAAGPGVGTSSGRARPASWFVLVHFKFARALSKDCILLAASREVHVYGNKLKPFFPYLVFNEEGVGVGWMF